MGAPLVLQPVAWPPWELEGLRWVEGLQNRCEELNVLWLLSAAASQAPAPHSLPLPSFAACGSSARGSGLELVPGPTQPWVSQTAADLVAGGRELGRIQPG